MTPAAVEAKYGVPPGRYPELAAIVGETSDNLPGVPGVGPETAAKWINQFDGLDNVVAHAEEITGKTGQALREHLDDVIRNRRLNALVCDLSLAGRAGRPRAASLGPPGGAQAPRRPGVPGAARPALRHAGAGGGDRRLRLRGRRRPARRGRGRGLAGRARPRRRPGRGPGAGQLGGGHRRRAFGRPGPADGSAAYVATDKLTPDDEARSWPGSPTPTCRRSCTTPRARCSRWRRWAGRWPGCSGHRAVGLPRPPRPALLRPGRPDPAPPQARAQGQPRPTTSSS